MPVLVKGRGTLIASAATITTSATVASAGVARTASVIGAGGIAGCGSAVGWRGAGTGQTKNTSDTVTGIIAAIRSNAVARPPRMALATLHSRQQRADQRRTADRDDDCRQRIVHGFPPF
jgi:hypothetical protein